MTRYILPDYNAVRRAKQQAPHMVEFTFSVEEAIWLAHDVLMGCAIHRTPDKDRKHAYQARLLALALESNDKLWDPLLEEISQCWADVQIQRFINRLDEFVCTRDWEWPSDRYGKDEAAEQYAKDHPAGNSGTCIGHCCIHHGCKYGKGEDCCVESGKAQQETPCEACSWEQEEDEERRARDEGE